MDAPTLSGNFGCLSRQSDVSVIPIVLEVVYSELPVYSDNIIPFSGFLMVLKNG